MKRILIILLIILTVSCSKRLPEISTKNGFGKLKLNTSLNEFIFKFDTSESKTMSAYPNGDFEMEFDSLAVSNQVTVRNVNLMFYKKSLGRIIIESSDEIFDVLEKQNGIVKDFTDNKGKRQVLFSTESKNVVCKYEKIPNRKGIIIFNIVK